MPGKVKVGDIIGTKFWRAFSDR